MSGVSTSRIICSDVIPGLQQLDPGSVQTVVTSPPYWGLRNYGIAGQIGLEETPEEYTQKIVEVFTEIRRALRNDGTVWLNLGDSYATQRNDHIGGGFGDKKVNSHPTIAKRGRHCPEGLKMKDLIGTPWRVAFALQTDGWYLRSEIIWAKPNSMPESVKDRPTKAHEQIFLLTKKSRYFYDADAVRAVDNHPLGRNLRSVWTIATQPYPEAHFATFPEKLVEPCIKAGSPKGGIVLDPFCGSGTTGYVALKLRRSFIGIELNPEYVKQAEERIGYAYDGVPAKERRNGQQSLFS